MGNDMTVTHQETANGEADIIRQGNEIARMLFSRMAEARFMRDSQAPIFTNWNPGLRDIQDDVRASWRPAVARAIDAIHNSGVIAGAIEQASTDTIGSELRLSANPDANILGWSDEEKAEWCLNVEKRWHEWSNNPHECDKRGMLTVGEMTDAALRWNFCFGEYTAHFMRESRSKCESKLKVYMVSPHLLSSETSLEKNLFQGVYTDQFGRPKGYRFVKKVGHVNKNIDYKAFDRFGRRQVLHIFSGVPGQVRGMTPLAPVLKTIRQYTELHDATLTTALLQTILAATITSPQMPTEALEMLNEGATDKEPFGSMTPYMSAMVDWASRSSINLGEHGKVTHLFPGEELNLNSANAPSNNYLPFYKALLREISRCLGVTYSSISNDHTDASYSSVRMENATIWPIVKRRRDRVAAPLPDEIYNQWLEEEVAYGRIEFPGGYSKFLKHQTAASRSKWHGPAKPTADDRKSAQAQTERLKNGTSCLTMEAAEAGIDFDDLVEAKKREENIYNTHGWHYAYTAEPIKRKDPEVPEQLEYT